MRNTAVNSNCTACVDTNIVPCSAVSASSRHVLSVNNYTAESGKCVVICMRFSAVGFSPLPEISGISIVMYVSELFVDGKCIIDSLVRRTFARGAIRKSADFSVVFWIIHIKRNSSSSSFIR